LLASSNHYGSAWVWDLATGKGPKQFVNPLGEFRRLTFSPNSKFLACLSGRTDPMTAVTVKEVVIWDVADGKITTITAPPLEENAILAIAPDGKTVALHSSAQIYLYHDSTNRWE